MHETVAENHAEYVPRTIAPPITNGGVLRSMDNHRLAAWLAEERKNAVRHGQRSEEEYFHWLGQEPENGQNEPQSLEKEQ